MCSGLTCAALTLHGPHEVVGSLLAVQRLQQVKNIIIKHEVDQVEGAWTQTHRRSVIHQKQLWLHQVEEVTWWQWVRLSWKRGQWKTLMMTTVKMFLKASVWWLHILHSDRTAPVIRRKQVHWFPCTDPVPEICQLTPGSHGRRDPGMWGSVTIVSLCRSPPPPCA